MKLCGVGLRKVVNLDRSWCGLPWLIVLCLG